MPSASQGGNVTRDGALWPVTRGCGELTLGTTPRDLGLVTVVVGCGMWPPDCVMLPQYCGFDGERLVPVFGTVGLRRA